MKFTEKLKLIRKKHSLTQAEFAESIGISRGNLSGLEIGKVRPTAVIVNCISLMYNVDKGWLLDDDNNDVSALQNTMASQIAAKYEQLDARYKRFVEHQINELLEMQQG